MAWFKTRATPSDLAVALLIQCWRGEDETSPIFDLLNPRADERTIKGELFCLDYFATAFGIELGFFPKSYATGNRVLSAFHFFNSLMQAEEVRASSDAKLAEAQRYLQRMLADYCKSYPDGEAEIQRTRPFVPAHSLVTSRYNGYRRAMTMAGEAAIWEVAKLFAENIRAPKDPIVIGAATTQLSFQFAMVRDAIPKYKIVS